jgi:hypothetical protein
MSDRSRTIQNPPFLILHYLLHSIVDTPYTIGTGIDRLSDPKHACWHRLVVRISQSFHHLEEVWKSSYVEVATSVGGHVIEGHADVYGIDLLQEVRGRERVDADLPVDATGYINEAVESARQTIGDLESKFWKQGTSLLEVGGEEGLVGSKWGRFVAAHGGVAGAIYGAVGDVSATDERVEFFALGYVRDERVRLVCEVGGTQPVFTEWSFVTTKSPPPSTATRFGDQTSGDQMVRRCRMFSSPLRISNTSMVELAPTTEPST